MYKLLFALMLLVTIGCAHKKTDKEIYIEDLKISIKDAKNKGWSDSDMWIGSSDTVWIGVTGGGGFVTNDTSNKFVPVDKMYTPQTERNYGLRKLPFYSYGDGGDWLRDTSTYKRISTDYYIQSYDTVLGNIGNFIFDTVKSNGQDTTKYIPSAVSNGSITITGSWTKQNPAFDTIPVIMLVSDTAIYETGFRESITCKEAGCDGKHSLWVGHSRPIKTPYGARPTMSIIGYEVSELHLPGENAFVATYDNRFNKIWKYKEYLNENKQPLDKNIIVWMSVKH